MVDLMDYWSQHVPCKKKIQKGFGLWPLQDIKNCCHREGDSFAHLGWEQKPEYEGPKKHPSRKPSSSISLTRGVAGGPAGGQCSYGSDLRQNTMALMMDPEAGEHGGNGYAYNPCHPPSSPRSMDDTEAFSSEHSLPASILLAPRSKGPSDSLRTTTMSKKGSHLQPREEQRKQDGAPKHPICSKKGDGI